MVDQDWFALDYVPARLCPCCHAPLRAGGYQDIEGYRCWTYLPVECNCYTAFGVSEKLPANAPSQPAHRPKQVIGLWKSGPAFPAALLPAVSLSTLTEQRAYFRAWNRRANRAEAVNAAGAEHELPQGKVVVTEPPLGVGHNWIWQADALALLGSLRSGSVDLLLIDPPYNITELDFEQEIDWPSFWKQARRVMREKDRPIISFSQQPFTTDLILSNRRGWRYEIIWEKTMPVGFLDANRRPLRTHENIQVFGDAMPRYFPIMAQAQEIRATARKRDGLQGHYNRHERSTTWQDSGLRYPRSVWTYAQRNTSFENTFTYHPTEKPLPLIERLVEMYSCPGDLVVDCFCGAGPVAIAARNTNRRFICGDNGVDERTGRSWAQVARARLAEPYTPALPLLDVFAPPAVQTAFAFAAP